MEHIEPRLVGEVEDEHLVSGLDARTPAAAASTLDRRDRMLPLLSMSRPIETGMSSRRNSVMGWRLPFSKTENARSSRFVTRLAALVGHGGMEDDQACLRSKDRGLRADARGARAAEAPATAARGRQLVIARLVGPGASCSRIGDRR